ncbi:DUF4113 domain-containing protein, partial [Aquabacterium sp. A08]|uniref:DUF4113 domain-containing protein n=1 Tax=Aquabacterium sp. A08 TaxID=2718532 RepID=UPI0014212491
ELNGVPCLALDEADVAKQAIACTRSFGQTVTALADLRQAVTEFAGRAAVKLRRQGSHAALVQTYIRSSPFRPQRYARALAIPLVQPTADTLQIAAAALRALDAIYRPGVDYAKAGVLLLGLEPASERQTTLPWAPTAPASAGQRHRLMQTLDALNARWGPGTVALGSAALRHAPAPRWAMRQQRRSPRYTTRWDELLTLA